jgi:hypothetical protein
MQHASRRLKWQKFCHTTIIKGVPMKFITLTKVNQADKIIVNPESISLMEQNGTHANIHINGGTLEVSETLREINKLINPTKREQGSSILVF